MSWSNVAALIALELRALVRDRRTVLLSIVLPLVVMPLFLFVSTTIEKRRQASLAKREVTYALGGSHAEAIRELLESAAVSPAEDVDAPEGAARAKFVERAASSPLASLVRGEIDLYVEAERGERADELLAEERERAEAAGDPPLVENVPVVRIHFRSNSTASSSASRRMVDLLDRTKRERQESMLAGRGLFVAQTPLGAIDTRDVASSSQAAGARIARFLTVLVVVLMLTGGATVASDVVAGERERGTLETLLTTAARRDEIVVAKLLVVFGVAVTIILLQLLSILLYSELRIIDLPSDYRSVLTPESLAWLLLLYLPVGALVAAVLLLLSGRARGYKEAQLYFFPAVVLGGLFGVAAILPGIDLRSAIAVVPISGISVAVKEVLVGERDWAMLALTWCSTAAAAALVARSAVRLLSSEDFITGSAEDTDALVGGMGLFRRHLFRWFALMWVALFLVSIALPNLDIRAQLAINLIGIFLAASLLIIRVYRLDPREVLSLRAPNPLAWLGVLIGAPSALVVGLGVSQLASYVVPVPRDVLEQFGKAIFPEGIPLWQMLLFVALLPGICEETAFRGLLLSGLRRKLKPVPLCIAVGLVFGLFHFTLFRLASTAFLGMLLAAVTLLTGSIFPAMLWHALNNGIATVAAYTGFVAAPPLWMSGVAVVPLAVSFWLLWLSRPKQNSRG
jgi:sodium transport system permease protein